MEVFSGIASFRTAADPRSFIIHVGDEEYVTIDETILCTRFRLVDLPCWSRERSLMIMDLFCERFTSGQFHWIVGGITGLDRGATQSLEPD